MTTNEYRPDRFALQFALAQKIAAVAPMPLSQALFAYTQVWYWIKIGAPHSNQNPVWVRYMAGLIESDDPQAWTAAFCREREGADVLDPAAKNPRFGCFSYSHWSRRLIRIHFSPQQPMPEGILDRAHMADRLAELKALFSHVKSHMPKARRVRGGSWLYNVEAYRRLFPPKYIETAKVVRGDWQYMALWGQFYDRCGRVKEEMAAPFLACVEQQRTLERVLDCFPYQVLQPDSAIQHFYDFYQIDRTSHCKHR
ncbi:MAG TPA: hypothetical protein VF177_18000 [Anaerolineae bacterium]